MSKNLFKPKILYRKRISKMLKGIFKVPLFFVSSPIGYGKTTAVRSFLSRKKDFHYAWFSLSKGEDDEVWMWHKFAVTLDSVNAKISSILIKQGLPRTTAERDHIFDIIKTYITEPVVTVIDDYHEIKSSFFNQFLTGLALKNISNLHVVLICRVLPEIPIDELALKGLSSVLSDLEFSYEEIGDMFRINGLEIKENEQLRLAEKTDGWTAAIYLAMLNYAESNSIELTQDITRIIKKSVYDKLEKETQFILLQVSALDSFDSETVNFVSGNKKAAKFIRHLADTNCFVRYDKQTGIYSIHALFQNMLADLFTISEIDKLSLFDRLGEWKEKTGRLVEAIDFYRRAGQYEKILNIFDQHGASDIFDKAPHTMIKAFNGMDKTQKISRPIAYITYIKSYLAVVDSCEGAKLLFEAKATYEANKNLTDKNQIFGEIALAESFLYFNNVAKMIKYQKKAYTLFTGARSQISSKKALFTFGSPHVLFLYHKSRGELLSLVELIENGAKYFIYVSNGCGTGFEYQARAEYYIETGDLKNAEIWAEKVLFKAKAKDQLCLVVCASLILARQAMLSGKPERALAILNEQCVEIENEQNTVLLTSFEIVKGYIYGILGDLDQIPQWLRDGQISDIFHHGMSFGYIVTGQAAILRKSYIELEIIVETMRETYTPNNNIFGFIYAGIYEAIVKKHIYGVEKASEAIIPVIECAQADDIITPFTENLPELLPVFNNMGAKRKWADEVIKMGRKLLDSIKEMNDKRNTPHLTKREVDVLVLLEKGYTQREIADTLCLSHNTVRRHLQNIYNKLSENNKISAINKAKEFGLIK